jgi:alanyl-tRNA synthetase
MTSREIRQQFLDFFKSKNHRIVSSSPVVPFDDPTLLFTNAGMNQFKDIFLGKGKRDYTRATDTQKCIRVSGKHNDLEEVGHDTYHHTFFEMLGNWSFGDYYKEEAIKWAWELLTDVWKLPKERLWATVYRTDDEAFEIWKNTTDIKPSHILRFNEKDNFWEMGETGPCGPCSEIHINLSDDFDNPKYVNAGDPKCIEIWNLVFIQYNRDENGTLHNLPAKHVDTGMGFERVCAVLQKKNSNYDTDVFQPIINAISEISKIPYKDEEHQIAMRVIADHIRTLTFAIADGAVPGNEGRGYVLRRILRRAARYGRKLDLKKPFMYKLVDVLVETMSDIFPEIKLQQTSVKKIIKAEEESFNVTLDRGIELFENIISNLEAEKIKIIPGDEAFKLYDTFGFPLDLTNVMAREKGFSVDENKFNELMNEQRERARKSTKEKISAANVVNIIQENPDLPNTIFLGYDTLEAESTILSVGENFVILDQTPFYAESGGQVDDKGQLQIGDTHLRVAGLVKSNNHIIHVIENETNLPLAVGQKVIAKVDDKRRWDIMRNHSATHFLHKALREILGTHVQQSGSLVASERLRFDFTHFQKMTEDEIAAVESIVNEKILENLPLIHHRDIPFDEAKTMGAMMFFGDKYGDKVNVVQFGNFTLEFCGGTHVKNSSQIGLFKIVGESSISSGIRRIEAVTGNGVLKYIHEMKLKLDFEEIKVSQLNDEKKKLEKQIAAMQLKEKLGGINSIVSNPKNVNGLNLYKGKVAASTMDELKSMGDELREKMKSGIGVLVSVIEDKIGIVAVVSDDLIKERKILSGNIVKKAAAIVGGSGGGRPHLATAGGKDVSKIDEMLSQLESIISSI